MTNEPDTVPWSQVEALFEPGAPAFVAELRRCVEADRLATFASRWFADSRPSARQFLLDYLDRPLNAYRHEPLVKRLFKLAEAAGDDEVMARFLVLFDRSVRRARRTRRRYEYRDFHDADQALALAEAWRAQGFQSVNSWQNWNGKHYVSAVRLEPRIVTPRNTTMP